MTVLSRQLRNLFKEANSSDSLAQAAVVVFCIGLAFLQPVGAILKRRRAHERKPDLNHVPLGCVFIPAYFLTQLVFLIGAGGQVVDLFMGKGQTSGTADTSDCRQVFCVALHGYSRTRCSQHLRFLFLLQTPTHKRHQVSRHTSSRSFW